MIALYRYHYIVTSRGNSTNFNRLKINTWNDIQIAKQRGDALWAQQIHSQTKWQLTKGFDQSIYFIYPQAEIVS